VNLSGDQGVHGGRHDTQHSAVGEAPQLASSKELHTAPHRTLLPESRGGLLVRLSGRAAESVCMAKPGTIAIRTNGKVLFIDAADVVACEAKGKYTVLRMPSRSYRLHESVSIVAERLRPFGFIRVHRSTIVNASFVEELRVSDSGEILLRLKDGPTEYRVSRKYRGALKSIACCWI
jgi:DNA-binding LytR/AlgR family response regulator